MVEAQNSLTETRKNRAEREREGNCAPHHAHTILIKLVQRFQLWFFCIGSLFLFFIVVFLFFSPFSWFWNLLQWSFVFTEISEIQSFPLVSQLPRFCSFRIRTSLCLEFRSRDLCACLCLRVCVCVCTGLCLCVCVCVCVCVYVCICVCVFFLGVECGGKFWSSRL
jgi:hypothetical protein